MSVWWACSLCGCCRRTTRGRVRGPPPAAISPLPRRRCCRLATRATLPLLLLLVPLPVHWPWLYKHGHHQCIAAMLRLLSFLAKQCVAGEPFDDEDEDCVWRLGVRQQQG